MGATVHISPAWLVMTAVAALLVIVLPFIFGVVARKKLAVGWKYFWFGTLVFLVFQLVTRVPAVIVLQDTVLAPLLRSSTVFVWIWLVILAVTAGLFEEVGRYVGYRVFMRQEPKTWSKAVMFGIGHEGLESALLVGGQLILTLVGLILITAIPVNSLPASERQTVVQQVSAINAEPVWFPLLAVWERLWSFPLQVALAVLVLQVFLRQQIRWLFLAILFHAVIDFTAVALPQAFGASNAITLIIEGLVCVFGLLAMWIIWRLRSPADVTAGTGEEPLAEEHDHNVTPQDVGALS